MRSVSADIGEIASDHFPLRVDIDLETPLAMHAAADEPGMTLFVFFAVLAAAAMHAIWNALVKVHLDRFLSITLMTLGMGAAALVVLPFVEVPKAEVWPYIIASVIFHMGYRTFLIGAYKAGDFAQTYPLARGTAPLLAALGGIVVVKEMPAPLAILGILLLSAGTLVMSFRGGAHLERLNLRAVGFALGTSIFIASYTLSDGSGARLAATAQSYAAWLFICDAAWGAGAVPHLPRPAGAAGAGARLEGGAVHRRAQRRCLLDRDVGDDQGADRLGGVAARNIDPVRHDDLGLRAGRKDDGLARCRRAQHRRRRRRAQAGLAAIHRAPSSPGRAFPD